MGLQWDALAVDDDEERITCAHGLGRRGDGIGPTRVSQNVSVHAPSVVSTQTSASRRTKVIVLHTGMVIDVAEESETLSRVEKWTRRSQCARPRFMKSPWSLLCCVVLTAALIACKSSAPASSEGDSEAQTEATAVADESAKPEATPAVKPDISAPPDVAAAPKDAEKSESGLAWKVLQAGEGDTRPDRYDIVTMNYIGWTPDGRMFLNSQKPGSKRRGRLEEFILGWIEGVQLMLPGEKRRFWVPGKLAYGEAVRGEANGDKADVHPDQPKGMVVFDIELVEFKRGPRPPRETPEDVAEIPKNAKKSKSGLAWRVLQHGTGMEHPTATSRVIVNYAAWTTDGKMFETSLALGRPASFVLETSMPGLQESIKMMVVGELRRVWIPENLAFADQPGRPKGMVVYDIHLLDVKN